jgi:uncharacterized protein involved in copper resistance
VNKRIRRMSRLPLMIVLLINTAVTGTGWAMNAPVTPPGQTAIEHSPCGESMEQMSGMDESPAVHTVPQHQHSTTNGCCTPGTCHCASPTPASEITVVPIRAPLLRVASIFTQDQGAFPAPDLPRLLRPPIA